MSTETWVVGLSFLIALLLGVVLTPLASQLGRRWGKVALPRQDRWHQKPTPVLGGSAIFFAFFISLILRGFLAPAEADQLFDILVICTVIFLLGLYDDFRQLSPQAKLVGQILAATLAISLGYTTEFFSPRIENPVIAQLPNILLTYFWLVGITNAINLLDNMDGLAGGICLITAIILSFFFWQSGDQVLLAVSLSIAGSVLAFLFFNFPPASIFMGDSGSLFLGFSLALLSIARQPQASNVFAVIAVPTLLFLLPILDTALVTVTRILRGQSPLQGGRDHTSHRLIAFGLNERQAVLVLYFIALLSGSLAATLESIQYWFSLVLVPLLVISLALLAGYLGGLKVIPPSSTGGKSSAITRIILDLTIKWRLLEILLDFFLIGIAYYLAIYTYYRFSMNANYLNMYLRSLPFAIGLTLLVFYLFRIYRGLWRYLDAWDLGRYALASLVGSLSLGMLNSLINIFFQTDWSASFPAGVLVLFWGFLFFGLAASRASYRLLDQIKQKNFLRNEARVLIIGTGDSTEMALRWLQMAPQMRLYPVGIVDDDPFKQGRQIHGIQVVGGVSQLSHLLKLYDIQGVILSSPDIPEDVLNQIHTDCKRQVCWIRRFRLELEDC